MGRGSLQEKNNRRERLLGLLRTEDIWTTSALCEELKISHRTLMRDLNELRADGYPIDSDRGRGGGIRLVGYWGVNRLNLSNEELISLLVSLAISESLNPPMMVSHAKSLRQKIANGFPESQRKTLNKTRARILVGKSASEQVLSGYRPPSTRVVDKITKSFFELKKVEIEYVSEKKELTKRIVEPQYLLLNYPVWYLLSWDELREDVRIFRVDRVVSVQCKNSLVKSRKKSIFLDSVQEYFSRL